MAVSHFTACHITGLNSSETAILRRTFSKKYPIIMVAVRLQEVVWSDGLPWVSVHG